MGTKSRLWWSPGPSFTPISLYSSTTLLPLPPSSMICMHQMGPRWLSTWNDSDKWSASVFQENLPKLEIHDRKFGDFALSINVWKYETMWSHACQSCDITIQGCKVLAEKMLNVEILNEKYQIKKNSNHYQKVEKKKKTKKRKKQGETPFGFNISSADVSRFNGGFSIKTLTR